MIKEMKKTVRLHDKDFDLYIEEAKIRERIRTLAKEISQSYCDKCPIFILVLKGAMFFGIELVQYFEGVCETEVIKSSSYEGTSYSGKLLLSMNKHMELKDRHVIIVEDIVDSGRTVKAIMDWMKDQGPASIKTASLLYKPEALEHPLAAPDYTCFEVPIEFLVGYGLDYDQLGRNLRDIYVLKAD